MESISGWVDSVIPFIRFTSLRNLGFERSLNLLIPSTFTSISASYFLQVGNTVYLTVKKERTCIPHPLHTYLCIACSPSKVQVLTCSVALTLIIMDPKRKNLYIILPGSVTGDLWHIAAAHILTKEYGVHDGFLYTIVAVIAYSAQYDGSKQQEEDYLAERKYGATTFNYFEGIGVDCMAMKVCGYGPGKGSLEEIMYAQPNDWFDEQFSTNLEVRKPPSDEPNSVKLSKSPKPEDLKEFHQVEGKRVLKLMTATTIAMKFLYHDEQDTVGRKETADPKKFIDQERFKKLGLKMTSPKDQSVNDHAYVRDANAAEEQYKKLEKLIGTVMKAGIRGVVLENYRGGNVNTQTDSNPDISKQFSDLAKKKKFAVITIAAVKDLQELKQLQGEPGRSVFDFYNKGDNKAAWPGIEPRAQAIFWVKVASNPCIFGLFGGRSGSIDVAGFCGVNSFFWDDPWVEFASMTMANTRFDNETNNKLVAGQMPQCLRSLQLLAIMSVGTL